MEPLERQGDKIELATGGDEADPGGGIARQEGQYSKADQSKEADAADVIQGRALAGLQRESTLEVLEEFLDAHTHSRPEQPVPSFETG